MRYAGAAFFLLPITGALAGCAMLPPAETPEEAQARRSLSCQQAGIPEGSPEFRLCVLLQQTNERLDAVERRLGWIEQDVRFPPPFYGRYWW
jgi:hypothetical protein